jgi:hypothetical protein
MKKEDDVDIWGYFLGLAILLLVTPWVLKYFQWVMFL